MSEALADTEPVETVASLHETGAIIRIADLSPYFAAVPELVKSVAFKAVAGALFTASISGATLYMSDPQKFVAGADDIREKVTLGAEDIAGRASDAARTAGEHVSLAALRVYESAMDAKATVARAFARGQESVASAFSAAEDGARERIVGVRHGAAALRAKSSSFLETVFANVSDRLDPLRSFARRTYVAVNDAFISDEPALAVVDMDEPAEEEPSAEDAQSPRVEGVSDTSTAPLSSREGYGGTQPSSPLNLPAGEAGSGGGETPTLVSNTYVTQGASEQSIEADPVSRGTGRASPPMR